ncbi:ArsA-related P-loop ATPase [Hoyosella subflava]|uniref:Possible arsenite-transporting ATPase n=1 Tax=Hoyosella subflava (strain DSM 45089 / JCM 17490 / NBRC 109087 / DQS3-9A1) TaxID=443218 RepID=F6EG13_HOYSD|nr:ArsA-related P-loop ATPase [Hoyosella subflava]AEF38715.1 Possible arsenite-transporting ATPase [Hoyosella subflava DQS3-9A1]
MPTSELWTHKAANARLHFVTGKGGTGKSTAAAALALTLAAGGRRVLLAEVEGRQGIAQLFDIPPLPYAETKVASADGGGEVRALAIDIEAAFLEYLDMFYNLGLAGRAMRKVGAVEFATTLAPGLRDVILTGKIKECVIRREKDGRPTFDAVVVDAPPTGRIGTFLDVTKAMADLAKSGPIRSQSEGVVRLLHSDETVVHVVTLLESLPVQESIDAIEELRAKELRIGSIIVNRTNSMHLPEGMLDAAAQGELDRDAAREGLKRAGLRLSDEDFDGLLTQASEYAIRTQAQRESARELEAIDIPQLSLPTLTEGVDLGGLYELAEALANQGVK